MSESGGAPAHHDPPAEAPVARGAALPDPEYLPEHTVEERVARGCARRERVPPARLGDWQSGAGRADPLDILEGQSAERIAELVPLRYGRMASSPFAFYRGAAAVMAADLATLPSSGLRAQLCGDAHLMNFGMFDTPERKLVFGVNDFDETLPGPFEWDVLRLATSIEVAARDVAHPPADAEAAVLATVQGYRAAMAEFATWRNIDVWHARLSAKELRRGLSAQADPRDQHEAKHSLHRALRHSHLRAFDKLITGVGVDVRFVHDPPLLVPVEELLDAAQRSHYVEIIGRNLEQYRATLSPHLRALVESYRFHRLARKVVGVGSVGTRAWVALLLGRDDADPLLLQIKEATTSVLEPYAGASAHESSGRRVVEGQRFMQAASDPLLGWLRSPTWDGVTRDFYVRQLWDGKSSIDVTRLSPGGLAAYGAACGWTLARGHARSGDRIAIDAYLGTDGSFDATVATFAQAYADRNALDHQALVDAVALGRVEALAGI